MTLNVNSTPQVDENIEKVIIDTTPEMRPAIKSGSLVRVIFMKKVEDTYEKIVYWRRNLFLLLTGNASKNYINEMTVNHRLGVKVLVALTVKGLSLRK